MGLSDQEVAAGRTEDHGTQHNARGRDRQKAWLARQERHAGCTTPQHPFSRLTAQSGTCLGGRPANAARCTRHRSTPHRPTQHAAPAIAARCIAQRNALHQPSHRTAFPVPQQHLLPGKRQTQPQLPSTARLGQTSKRPLTTARDPLQHGTLTHPIAPAASTSLTLLSPAVSQPYKIRCAE